MPTQLSLVDVNYDNNAQTVAVVDNTANRQLVFLYSKVDDQGRADFDAMVASVGNNPYGVTRTPLASVTSLNGVATATFAAHGFANGDYVLISGATVVQYNGVFVIRNVTTNTFDYAVQTSITTPATGTVAARQLGINTLRNYTIPRINKNFYDTYAWAIKQYGDGVAQKPQKIGGPVVHDLVYYDGSGWKRLDNDAAVTN